MNKLMKKSSGIIVAICCVFMLGVNVMTVWGANWRDNGWEFSACPTATEITDPEEKEDTSKVYVKNAANSAAFVSVSIYGKKGSEFDDCTYNSAYSYKKTPYEISKGTYKYCSSTVFETYGAGCYAYLHITGYSTGTYIGLWSPDNYYGY